MKRKSSLFSKALLAIFSLSLVLVMLSSCGTSDNLEGVTLQVAVFPDLDKSFPVLIEGFKEKYPGVNIELRVNAWGDHHNILVTQFASGTDLPDVAAVDLDYIGQIGAGGGCDNLAKAPYNCKKYEKLFVPFSWAQASISKDEVVGMPIDIAPGCAFYRKDILDKYGINYEDIKTMDDLFEVGKKVTKDLNGDGKADQWLVGDATDIFQIIIRSDSTRYFDEKGNPVLDRALVRKAMELTKKFFDAGLSAQINQWTPEWYAGLSAENGGIVYTPTGAWMLGHLKNWMATNLSGEYRAGYLPAIEQGKDRMYASWGGSFLVIPKKSKNKAAAWKFIEYMTTVKENQIESFKVTAAFPSMMAAWDDKVFDEGVEYIGNQKARKHWIDVAKNIPVVYVNQYDAIAKGILLAEVQKVLYENKSIDQALEDAQAEMLKQMQ